MDQAVNRSPAQVAHTHVGKKHFAKDKIPERRDSFFQPEEFEIE